MSIFTRKMTALVAFLLLSQLVIATPMSNVSGSPGPHVTITYEGLKFVATIEAICQDPMDEGYFVRCRVGETIVLIWEDDVRNLTIGARYSVLFTYVGPMPFPSGDVNVYVGIVWIPVELYDGSE